MERQNTEMRWIFVVLFAVSFRVVLVAQPVRSDTMAILPLEVISADKEHVALRWSLGELQASQFVVERRSESDVAGSEIARTTQPFFTDKTINALETYTYRIRIFAENGRSLGVTEERVVGPPPMGFSNVIRLGGARPGRFGQHLSMCLDENDDPAFGCLIEANHGLDPKSRQLVFVRWSRTKYKWLDPVIVDILRDVPETYLGEQISICRDPASDVFYLAYRANQFSVRVAESRKGDEWIISQVDRSDSQVFDYPRIIAINDQITIAYFVDNKIKLMKRLAKMRPFQEVKLDSVTDIGSLESISQLKSYIRKEGIPVFVFFANRGDLVALLCADGVREKLEHRMNALPPIMAHYTDNFFVDDSIVIIRLGAKENNFAISSEIAVFKDGVLKGILSVDGWSFEQFDISSNKPNMLLAKLSYGTDSEIQKLVLMKADKNFVWKEYVPSPNFSFVAKAISELRMRILPDDTIYCAFLSLDTSSKFMQGVVLYRGR